MLSSFDLKSCSSDDTVRILYHYGAIDVALDSIHGSIELLFRGYELFIPQLEIILPRNEDHPKPSLYVIDGPLDIAPNLCLGLLQEIKKDKLSLDCLVNDFL